jgi:hypothetical protein
MGRIDHGFVQNAETGPKGLNKKIIRLKVA